ncbi:sugar ABC transporter ATP-binding protein [Rhizobium sullae]|uniref:Sugar ABC transporter ATP-binding protein n=1 Tax=Rhizobium sullae TaxID=50338 RepID=A0A2N0D7D1_RHISU|nr:carbohydrate ABC transporter permease [Rhizobium sullae]PKA42015.1 sugar ABC transporter ATP-binding protein [Rhizobium sullae]
MSEVTHSTPARSRPGVLRSARERRRLLNRWLWGIGLWALALLFLAPFAWMISTSLKQSVDAYRVPMEWVPDPVQWRNYVEVLTGEHSVVPAFLNSLFVAALRVTGELVTASMAGYAFAMIRFRAREFIFLLYLATATIPAQLLLVPRFIYFQKLGLYDTLWSLILPGMFTVFGTFLMRQFFVSQPRDFAEAARIDGASEWQIFRRIYLPMAAPVLSALGILAFVWSWNDYEAPLVLISNPDVYTLPLSLTNFTDEQGQIDPGLSMAASVVSILPILIVFIFLQRRFVAAMTHSGLK